MDARHRDKVAFIRVCSGHFEKGMKVRVARTGARPQPGCLPARSVCSGPRAQGNTSLCMVLTKCNDRGDRCLAHRNGSTLLYGQQSRQVCQACVAARLSDGPAGEDPRSSGAPGRCTSQRTRHRAL